MLSVFIFNELQSSEEMMIHFFRQLRGLQYIIKWHLFHLFQVTSATYSINI